MEPRHHQQALNEARLERRNNREPDRVIIRRWRAGPEEPEGSVIALFPDDPQGVGLVQSYEHVGQHGTANYNGVVAQTTLVRPGDPDALELLTELRRIGYNPLQMLRRVRRRTR